MRPWWLSFQVAAEEVERGLGVSWGGAQRVLLDAIQNGDVKSQRRDGGFPNVWGDDLERWLEAKQGPSSKRKTSYNQELAKRAIAELYADGRVPDWVRPKEIVKAVNDWLKVKGKLGLERDTILRAAGRRK
jgi:hypothetical protein